MMPKMNVETETGTEITMGSRHIQWLIITHIRKRKAQQETAFSSLARHSAEKENYIMFSMDEGKDEMDINCPLFTPNWKSVFHLALFFITWKQSDSPFLKSEHKYNCFSKIHFNFKIILNNYIDFNLAKNNNNYYYIQQLWVQARAAILEFFPFLCFPCILQLQYETYSDVSVPKRSSNYWVHDSLWISRQN